METAELYEMANTNHIEVMKFDLPLNGSISVKDNEKCFIGLDSYENSAEERVHLAHELGHCITGSFYNIYSNLDIREKHENRATKWAIKKLIPFDELTKYLNDGIVQKWELAEIFNVTEDYIDKAFSLYFN